MEKRTVTVARKWDNAEILITVSVDDSQISLTMPLNDLILGVANSIALNADDMAAKAGMLTTRAGLAALIRLQVAPAIVEHANALIEDMKKASVAGVS